MLLVIGDFLQVTSVKQLHIFAEKKETYGALCGSLWIKPFEPHQTVRQIGDSALALLLSPVQKVQYAPDNIEQIQALANTDTSGWPKNYLKLYLTTYLTDYENKHCIVDNDSEMFNIRAVDSQRDSKTGTCSVLVKETFW